MTWPSSTRALQRTSERESRTCRPRRGHFSSVASDHEQNMSVLFAQTSLWHDSQRTEASQDFYLSSAYRTCPFGQVLAISERRTKFWLPSPSAFVKVGAGCKPAGSTVDVRPSGRNIS